MKWSLVLVIAACGTQSEHRMKSPPAEESMMQPAMKKEVKAEPAMLAPDGEPAGMMAASRTEAPVQTETAVFGMGCFWGAEEHFYGRPGVIDTTVGYAGGETESPTYDDVTSHTTGHAEVVRVEYDPTKITYAELLAIFWESHDPTQGNRQGNDVGDNYRSTIYAYGEAQLAAAKETRDAYQDQLETAGFGAITTEIRAAPTFYAAEDYHQKYCIRNPQGYCGHGGTGVPFKP